MFSAQDAREKTDTFLKEEKRKAEEQITAAIKRGEHKCTLDFSPSEALKDWLRSLGYEVTCIVIGSADPFKMWGDSSSHTIVEW